MEGRHKEKADKIKPEAAAHKKEENYKDKSDYSSVHTEIFSISAANTADFFIDATG